jgi:di/tricarboxylate transporter
MTTDQLIISLVLVATMGMFLWGRWRHDLVALGALLACVFANLVPGAEAFSGFGHPAVITVACVLVLGYGLLVSGAVDVLAQQFLPKSSSPTVSILTLIGLAALLSAFMNNVGALALLMPIGIQLAAKLDLPPGKILMPLAFGSILGGMTTLIGTPPNLIVSEYRANTGAESFAMFDFAPVGLSVALVGILFIGLIGWRLVPHRKHSGLDSFDSGKYLSEVRIVEGSKAANKRLREVEQMLDETDAQIISMVRNEVRIPAPNSRRVLKAGDILIIEVEPESLASVLSSLGVVLEEDVPIETDDDDNTSKAAAKNNKKAEQDSSLEDEDNSADNNRLDEVSVQEMVVMPDAALVGRSAKNLWLRTRYGINLLAISRQGQRSIGRLRSTRIKAGDVLLMQGPAEALSGFASEFNCLPLAPRDIHVPNKQKAITAGLIMLAAVSLTATGVFPVAISFATAMLAYIVLKIVPLRSMYTAIDWPVIVLLAAMLPVANAIATTGTADLIARFLLDSLAQGDAVIALIAILVVTMFLSDVVNNAATAALMCPIAISVASQLDVNADAFLMAVAIGASCAFLTPIGHQNNTLILGPGGLRFGDFWRMGILMEIIVVAISVPVLLWAWPL